MCPPDMTETPRVNARRPKGRREHDMPQTNPWHSIKEPHHHNNTTCGPGSQIPPQNKVQGTGGKPLCKDCADLNRRGK